MNDRKKQILKAIVEEYIEHAEPIGSQALVKRHPLQLSSATVRNVMAELEQEGYLEQPHTSAGRCPSDQAYRFYVDDPEIRSSYGDPQDPLWTRTVEETLQEEQTDRMELLQKASSLLSTATGYTALALGPSTNRSELLQIKMLMIEPGKVLVVLVLRPGVVRDQMIRVPPELKPEVLNLLNQVVEQAVTGKRVEEITWVAVETAAQGLPLPESLLNQVLFEAYLVIKQADQMDAYMEGVSNILAQPEFQESRKAKELLDLLLHDGVICAYLNEPELDIEYTSPSDQAALMIRIGQEIALPGMEECSFVTTSYRYAEHLSGKIAIVGPKRMPYRSVISKISFVRQVLERQFFSQDQEI